MALNDNIESCIEQQPASFGFGYKYHLKVENHYMKVDVPIRVNADFEYINKPQGNCKQLFK